MKTAIVPLILLLMLASSASSAPVEEDFEQVASLTASVDISGDAEIVKEDSRARVDRATVNLSMFPKDGPHQSVEDIEWTPDADVDGEAAIFSFQSPTGEIAYRVSAAVKTGDSFVEVKGEIPFPVESLPDKVKPFAEPTEVIDSDNEAINRVASQLVAGEDDLFGAVYTLAKWTRENVNYNLSSVTADVSQKASWVLLERRGVCDEITSLFIAMLRSLGIPSKFITGYAYTNSPLFPENWGAHGWAEVYFPGYGWMPFDITYGQFGWVDSSHIKLKESADPNDASTKYEWTGRDAELAIGEIKTTVSVLGKEGKAAPLVQIIAKPMKQEIGFGSYTAIEATVKNLKDSYVMAELLLTMPEEVKLRGKKARDIMLSPGEEKQVFWIARLEGSLDENYLYTFPFTVKGGRGAMGGGSFKSTAQSPQYTLQEIGSIIDQREEEEEKVYSSNVALNCTASPSTLYEYEHGKITCTVRNIGNVPLDEMSVCLRKECNTIDLGITKAYGLEFGINTLIIGKREEQVLAKNAKVSRVQDVLVEVRDAPAIGIGNIKAPSSMEFEENATLSFDVGKISYSAPQNLTILLWLPSGERGWTIEKLTRNQSFSLSFRGKSLRKGENAITISIGYLDGNGREYSTAKVVPIALENVSLRQDVQLFIRDIGVWIESIVQGLSKVELKSLKE